VFLRKNILYCFFFGETHIFTEKKYYKERIVVISSARTESTMSKERQALSEACDEIWFQKSLERFFDEIGPQLGYRSHQYLDSSDLSIIICNLIRDDWERRAREHVSEKFGKKAATSYVVRTAEDLVAMVMSESARSL
jgi:hypothetical protein